VGGVIRGVLTSELKANEYFRLVKSALDSEKKNPNNMMLDVDVAGEIETNDIGDKGVFSHRIYHFEVDPTTFTATKVMFASKWISSNLGKIRLDKLRSWYDQVKRTPSISRSALGNAYEQFIFRSWCGSSDQKLSVKIFDEQGNAKEEIFRCGTIRNDCPLISTADQFCRYIKKLHSNSTEGDSVTIIKPTSERFPAIDFGVYDHSGKHLLLVQVTISKDKELSVSTLKEFDPLFEISGLLIEQVIVTDCDKLLQLSWGTSQPSKSLTNDKIEELKLKWTPRTRIVYFS
jgi:hypothetical protein